MSPTADADKSAKPKPSRLSTTLKKLVRARVTAGLAVVLPIYVTYLLVTFVFGLMRHSSEWVVEAAIPRAALVDGIKTNFVQHIPSTWRAWTGMTDVELADSIEQWGIAIFSVFLTIFILYAIGLLTTNLIGRRTLAALEALLDRVPLVKSVYRASKQVLASFTGQAAAFQRVCMLPFMSDRTCTIGFITNVFKEPVSGEEMCAVFFASTPNPTTGFLLIARRADVVELDWTVEEAVKAIMSGGIVLPEWPPGEHGNWAAQARAMVMQPATRS